jgi:hypothetical protein
MGVNNLKLETEIFEFQTPFRIPGHTPVETKPDFAQLFTQIGQLTLAVSQIHQVVTGQAFTRAAPVADLGTIGEDLRKLSSRLDDIETRLPAKTQKN